MQKPQLVIIVFVILAVVGIYLMRTKLLTNPTTRMKFEEVHIVIDDSIIDSSDPYAIIDPVWYSVVIHEGQEKYEQSLKSFSLPQRYVSTIYWYLAEVNNGGHDQFYFNSTGIVWEDAMKGFQEIGLTEFSDIIQESAKQFGGLPSKDRFKRQEQMDKIKPDFSDLDTKVYQTENKIDAALMEYIKKNRADFYFDGIVRKPKI